MNHRVGMFMILLVVIVLGGCQLGNSNKNQKPSEMDAEDLPDVEAFNDEFTRDFLQLVEETEEGFYPFLSGTGKYKMNFPAGGVIDDKMYTNRDNIHEDVPISIEDDTGFGMSVLYFSDDNKKLLEDNLDAFKTRLGYEGEFEKLEKSNRTIYYANQEDDVFRTYAAYILNGKNSGAIEVIYNIDCQDEKEEICEKNKESDKERALKWIESVEFINGEEGENHE